MILAVAEEDEVLPQDANRPWQVLQLRGEAHRVPEAAQVFPAGGARTNVGQLLVFLGHIPPKVGAVRCDRSRYGCRHRRLLI